MLKIDNASARIAGITVLRDITTEFKPGQSPPPVSTPIRMHNILA
jgi:hypothetical protein